MNALERAVDMVAKNIIVRMVHEDAARPRNLTDYDWELIQARMNELIKDWAPPPQFHRRAYAWLRARNEDQAS